MIYVKSHRVCYSKLCKNIREKPFFTYFNYVISNFLSGLAINMKNSRRNGILHVDVFATHKFLYTKDSTICLFKNAKFS